MDKAKLFMNGRSQAVRLPKKFNFSGTEVYVKRLGRNLILMPANDPWDSLEKSLSEFSPDFMEDRIQPDAEKREPL
jgi:antitoxin VapB